MNYISMKKRFFQNRFLYKSLEDKTKYDIEICKNLEKDFAYFYPLNITVTLKLLEDMTKNQTSPTSYYAIDAAFGNGKSFLAQSIYILLNYNNLEKPNSKVIPKDFERVISMHSKLESITKNTTCKTNFKCIYLSLDKYDYTSSFIHTIYILHQSLLDYILYFAAKGNTLYLNTYSTVEQKMYFRQLGSYLKNLFKIFCQFDNTLKTIYNLLLLLRKTKDQTPFDYEIQNDERKYKKILNNLKLLINEINQNEEEYGGKVIFIIDNLDKCNGMFVNNFIENIQYLSSNNFLGNNVIFVFMINQEHSKNLLESKYGHVDMHHFYNLTFSKIYKLFLKPKPQFVCDLIIQNDKYKHFKRLYEGKMKTWIDNTHDYYNLTLYEIRKVIDKIENLLKSHSFIYLDNPLDTYNSIEDIFLKDNALVKLFYSLIIIQIIDIKSFNKLLYDNMKLSTYSLDTAKIDTNDLNALIEFANDKIYNMFFESSSALNQAFNDCYIGNNFVVRMDSFNDLTIDEHNDEITIKTIPNGITSISIEKIISKEKFHLSYLYSYEDYLLYKNQSEEIFSCTFRDYLRIQLSII